MSVSQSLSDECKHEIDEQKALSISASYMESLSGAFKQQFEKKSRKANMKWFRD